jgi:hypothetical protein
MCSENHAFLDYYRCPETFVNRAFTRAPLDEDAVCLTADSATRSTAGSPNEPGVHGELYGSSALSGVAARGEAHLPIDSGQVIDILRREGYLQDPQNRVKNALDRVVRKAYHQLRPALPLSLRKHLQRVFLRGWEELPFPNWPVDRTVENLMGDLMGRALRSSSMERMPFIWFWPEGASSAVVLTHDVETLRGRDFCTRLLDLDGSVGMRASYGIVPEKRYPVTASLLDRIRGRGCEVHVHDLNHDGLLFDDRRTFLRRVQEINRYGREFAASGFRSGVMYRNQEWFEALEFSYDMSVPNVAHLDPQRGGCCTVMPFYVGKILELPLTTVQDYSLLHIVNDYSIDLWKRQIDLITEKHGLVSFIVHPDYVIEERAREVYLRLLDFLTQLRVERNAWFALPGEVNRWWRERSRMRLVEDNGAWRIEGPGEERARVAYASLAGENIRYTIESRCVGQNAAFAGFENSAS